MITYNKDGVYFKVTSSQIKTEINAKDVLSFTVAEEQGKLTTGSITMLDDGGYYSAIKKSSILSLEWGYSIMGTLPGVFRKGLNVMVISPSCNLAEISTTTINFRSGFSMIKDRKKKLFNDSKLNVVSNVMLAAGILIPVIDFTGSNERGQFRQDSETDFQFLSRLSREWKKQFLIGYSPSGQPIGMFTDYKSPQNERYLGLITGAIPADNLFEYNSGLRNVISADIEENFSESGIGEQIRFVMIDGQAVKQSTQAQTQIVKAFKFNAEKMRQEAFIIEKKNGAKAAQKFLEDILKEDDVYSSTVSRFWTEVDYKTATPHSGMKVDIKTFGNPLLSVPSHARLGAGFPSSVVNALGPSGTAYEIKKVTHNISASGYFCDIEIRNYLNL